jgi:hypothetical protein
MTTKNIYINGIKWKQRNLGKPYDKIWYLSNQHGWMIPNKQLCAALGLHDSSLSRWAKKAEEAQSEDYAFIKRVYAPTRYIKLEGESIPKMQILWTPDGVSWLMNKSGFVIQRWVKSNLQDSKSRSFLLCAQDEKPCVDALDKVDVKNVCTASIVPAECVAPAEVPTSLDNELTRSIKELATIIQSKLPALTASTNSLIQADVDSLRKINFELVLENEKHKSTIKELKSKLAEKENFTTPELTKLFDNEEYYVPAAFRKQALPETKFCIDLGTPNSLSLYIKNCKKSYTVDELNNLGLFNATRLYLETFSKAIDPVTNLIIDKNKFYNILRGEFVLTAPRARNPKVLAAAEKANYVVVVRVICPKMNNPKLADGTILEKDNPAFKHSQEPNLRPQIRYTSKAKKYLEVCWAALCEDYINGNSKRKSYSGAQPELALASSD